MRVLLVRKAKDVPTMVYGASEDGETLVEILGASFALLSPSKIIEICRENDCKITAEQYFLYVSQYVREMSSRQYISWTREAMNNIVFMMQDEEYEGSLDEMFNSDNYPLEGDLQEVLLDPGSYKVNISED